MEWMDGMGRDWRADQAFLLPSGALHGVRPRRPRSRLEAWGPDLTGQAGGLVNGSVSGIASVAGRSMSMHGGVAARGCFFLVGGEVGSWKNTTVHRQEYPKQTSRQGQLYQYGRRLLVPEPPGSQDGN